MSCLDCDKACLENTPDKCVLYTGPNFTKLGISAGMRLDQVILIFAEILSNLVDLGDCNDCKNGSNLVQAFQSLEDKVRRIDSRNIEYTGNNAFLRSNFISQAAAPLSGKVGNYKVNTEVDGTVLSYDLSQVVQNLPSGYSLNSSRVQISGKPKNGKTLIADTKKTAQAIKVTPDRYPLNMDVEARYGTPSGEVVLNRQVVIPDASDKDTNFSFNIKDTTANPVSGDMNEILDTVVAQVNQSSSELDNLKGIQAGEYKGDVRGVLEQLAAEVSELKKNAK